MRVCEDRRHYTRAHEPFTVTGHSNPRWFYKRDDTRFLRSGLGLAINAQVSGDLHVHMTTGGLTAQYTRTLVEPKPESEKPCMLFRYTIVNKSSKFSGRRVEWRGVDRVLQT